MTRNLNIFKRRKTPSRKYQGAYSVRTKQFTDAKLPPFPHDFSRHKASKLIRDDFIVGLLSIIVVVIIAIAALLMV